MEDRHITGGNGHVLLATLTVPGTLTDAIPSEPPRYALHDDMRMPDRLLRFDKLRPRDSMQVCATVYGDDQEHEDFHVTGLLTQMYLGTWPRQHLWNGLVREL